MSLTWKTDMSGSSSSAKEPMPTSAKAVLKARESHAAIPPMVPNAPPMLLSI